MAATGAGGLTARVLVVGGGPAGATCAAILGKHGVSVRLLERAVFPRPHVGESLQPAVVEILDAHLGLGPALAAMGFQRKYGATYVWGETRAPWNVLFDPRLDEAPPDTEAALLASDYVHSYQVERDRFDARLLEEARRRGVDVMEGADVVAVEQEDDRVVGVTTRDGERYTADLIVDATGHRCLVGRALGLTRHVADLRATATYAYYRGAGGFEAPWGRQVQYVVTIPAGWVWFIPLSNDRTSVGVVVRERAKISPARFEALVAQAELPLRGAEREGELFYARDWSFYHRRTAGPGWLLVGDAACFAILRVIAGEPAAEVFGAYDAQTRKLYGAHLRLARYWYGNNRSVEGFFWEAHREVRADALSTPLRAFVYLTSGQYAADRHFRVFERTQEQRMFERLGVDRSRLSEAWRARTDAS